MVRTLQRILLTYGFGKRTVAFIGDNLITTHLMRELKKDPRYSIIGIIDEKNKTSIGSIHNLAQSVKDHHIEELIQTTTDSSETKQQHILNFCRLNHLQYRFVPSVVEIHPKNIEIQTLQGIPLISLLPTPLDGWGKITKRTSDIIGGAIGLMMLSPLLGIIALAIKFDSPGPVLFSQLEDGSPTLRVGQYGKKFHFLKFRTMRHNTHQQRYTELADKNLRRGSPLMKIKDDPRVTKIGRLLRQSGLDELPQLWNVLKGEMSLVGPRPHLPEEVENYSEHHRFVHTIKPGLTGMAQISGRSDLEFEEENRLDVYYIENWSLLLDLKILLKTLVIPFREYRE